MICLQCQDRSTKQLKWCISSMGYRVTLKRLFRRTRDFLVNIASTVSQACHKELVTPAGMASVNKKDSMKKKMMPKVVKHLKDDIRTFGKEANDDKALIIDIEMSGKKMKKDADSKKYKKAESEKKESKKHEKAESKAEEKFEKVMREFKEDTLHSGSKRGPKVKSPKQAVAIAFSEKKRVTKKRKK